jgi:ribonuclease HI
MAENKRRKAPETQPGLFNTGNTPIKTYGQKDHSTIYCDGASSGNPGSSGIGVAIYLSDEDAEVLKKEKSYTISEFIGIATNNIAEYKALIRGLEKAGSLGLKKVKIYLDSELVVRQLNGVYKVKNKNLLPLWQKAMNLLKNFNSHYIAHVPREMNSEADSLARKAVKKAMQG